MVERNEGADGSKKRRSNGKKSNLRVNTSHAEEDKRQGQTPRTDASTPRTPANVRGSRDLRSPGAQKTPVAASAKIQNDNQNIPDFITQTDANGKAITPRSAQAIDSARRLHPSGPKPRLHQGKDGKLHEDEDDSDVEKSKNAVDPCESLLDSIRLMCCCLLPDDSSGKLPGGATQDSSHDNRVKLLGQHHPDDVGKKCLVLDLDETLVHSSFRAVPGADFVIPVQVCTFSYPNYWK